VSRRRRLESAAALGATLAAGVGPALDAPGPDSIIVLAHADVPGSVELARRYAEARGVPSNRVCPVSTVPGPDLDFAQYLIDVEAPLEACLEATGMADAIDALVLMRGLPLRVTLPDGAGRVSLAALLGIADSTRVEDGARLRGGPPGRNYNCGGSPCLGPAWTNPLEPGPFDRTEPLERDGVQWRPRLVTWLLGRTDEDALSLLESALQAEAAVLAGAPDAEAEVLFMDGRDPARGVLDGQADEVIDQLGRRGVEARRVPFDAELTGLRLSAFFTGTDFIGRTIEGNDFAPGAVVDNLTSFGAVPENFAPEGEAQVSIARWVARGVAAVHGTTDEPLNGCFPDRALVLDWRDGATLAEAYHGRLPFVYWHNAVLGDPLAAPFALRPEVTMTATPSGGGVRVRLQVEDPRDRGAPTLRLLLDGRPLEAPQTLPLELCFEANGAPRSLLAVARAAGNATRLGRWRSAGWSTLEVPGALAEPSLCVEPDAAPPEDARTPVDAALPEDAAVPVDADSPVDVAIPADAAPPEEDLGPRDAAPPQDATPTANAASKGGGCGVGSVRGSAAAPWAGVVLALAAGTWTRRRRRLRG